MLETLDYTIRIGSTPTFLYFDISTLPTQHTSFISLFIFGFVCLLCLHSTLRLFVFNAKLLAAYTLDNRVLHTDKYTNYQGLLVEGGGHYTKIACSKQLFSTIFANTYQEFHQRSCTTQEQNLLLYLPYKLSRCSRPTWPALLAPQSQYMHQDEVEYVLIGSSSGKSSQQKVFF